MPLLNDIEANLELLRTNSGLFAEMSRQHFSGETSNAAIGQLATAFLEINNKEASFAFIRELRAKYGDNPAVFESIVNNLASIGIHQALNDPEQAQVKLFRQSVFAKYIFAEAFRISGYYDIHGPLVDTRNFLQSRGLYDPIYAHFTDPNPGTQDRYMNAFSSMFVDTIAYQMAPPIAGSRNPDIAPLRQAVRQWKNIRSADPAIIEVQKLLAAASKTPDDAKFVACVRAILDVTPHPAFEELRVLAANVPTDPEPLPSLEEFEQQLSTIASADQNGQVMKMLIFTDNRLDPAKINLSTIGSIMDTASLRHLITPLLQVISKQIAPAAEMAARARIENEAAGLARTVLKTTNRLLNADIPLEDQALAHLLNKAASALKGRDLLIAVRAILSAADPLPEALKPIKVAYAALRLQRIQGDDIDPIRVLAAANEHQLGADPYLVGADSLLNSFSRIDEVTEGQSSAIVVALQARSLLQQPNIAVQLQALEAADNALRDAVVKWSSTGTRGRLLGAISSTAGDLRERLRGVAEDSELTDKPREFAQKVREIINTNESGIKTGGVKGPIETALEGVNAVEAEIRAGVTVRPAMNA